MDSVLQNNRPQEKRGTVPSRSLAVMSDTFDIEQVSEHEYRVSTKAEGQTVESLFRMNPDLLDQLELAGVDEAAVVEGTAQFLTQHQSVIDFPPMIDLEDIMATYENFPQQLRDHLEAG